MGSFELVPAEFPQEDWDNWLQFAEFPPLPNFFDYFCRYILCFNNEWLANFRRYQQRRFIDGQCFWMVKCMFTSSLDLRAYGVGINPTLASDICARRFLLLLWSEHPMFFMPRYIIGYPNTRGHCYLIAPLLLILHSYPIVKSIVCGMEIASNYVVFGEGVVRKSHSLDEFPYYWLRLFWKIVRNYHKISRTGVLSLENIPVLRAAIRNDSVPRFASEASAADLQLDRDLINNLCSSLRDFCDDSYGTPGGQSGLAYVDLMQKLSYDIPDFRTRFFLKLKVVYLCRYCPRGPFTDVFYCPVLSLSSAHLISNAFCDLGEVVKQQDLSCRQLVDGAPCGHVLDRFNSAELLNQPEIICFYIQREKNFKVSDVPDELVVHQEGHDVEYELLGSTVCFDCYQDAQGLPYGSFYHQRVEGDKKISAHVITHLRTQEQFVEINNGSLYECDNRVFKRTTPGSLHFYQKVVYSSFNCKVVTAEIKSAPYK